MTTEPTNAELAETRYMSDHFQWAAPGDRQDDIWLVRFEDRDMGDSVFQGEDAERQAWEMWNSRAPAWNCYVFRLARLRSDPPVDAPDLREAGDTQVRARALEEALPVLVELRKWAAVLHQNSVGCAIEHYGTDFVLQGKPKWLLDAEAAISNADVTITAIRALGKEPS